MRENAKSVVDRVVEDHLPVGIVRQRGKGRCRCRPRHRASVQGTLHLSSLPANAERLLGAIGLLEAGEEPLCVLRRLVRFASEDIGLAEWERLRGARRG